MGDRCRRWSRQCQKLGFAPDVLVPREAPHHLRSGSLSPKNAGVAVDRTAPFSCGDYAFAPPDMPIPALWFPASVVDSRISGFCTSSPPLWFPLGRRIAGVGTMWLPARARFCPALVPRDRAIFICFGSPRQRRLGLPPREPYSHPLSHPLFHSLFFLSLLVFVKL